MNNIRIHNLIPFPYNLNNDRNGICSKVSSGGSSESTSGFSSMTQSSESASNESSQNNSSSGSSATSSSGQASTDSDSSGSGLGCEESIGSESPPRRNNKYNTKTDVIHCYPSPDPRLDHINKNDNKNHQVVVTRAVININPQVLFLVNSHVYLLFLTMINFRLNNSHFYLLYFFPGNKCRQG